MIITDQHFGNAGSDKTDSDKEEEGMDRQDRIENTGQKDPQDRLKGRFDGEICIRLLKQLFLYDMREQRICGRGEDAGNDIAEDTQSKEDDDVGTGLFKEKHEDRCDDDHATSDVVTGKHDLCFMKAVTDHASNRSKDQHRNTAQRQIQTLQRGTVVRNL